MGFLGGNSVHKAHHFKEVMVSITTIKQEFL